jgi:hypothetical protein
MNRNLKSKVMKSAIHLSVIVPAILILTLLTSCGGNGSSTTTTATTPPGATSEIINGITVPIAPDTAANAATIKGVDSNNNGVRDDVERLVANSTTQKTFANDIVYVKTYSTILEAKTTDTLTREQALDLMKKLQCFDFQGDPKTIRNPGGVSLVSQIFDTPERQAMLEKIGLVLGGYDSEEVQCD